MDAMYYYYLRLQDFLQPRRRRFILSLQKCKRGKMMFASIHHFSRKLNSLLCIHTSILLSLWMAWPPWRLVKRRRPRKGAKKLARLEFRAHSMLGVGLRQNRAKLSPPPIVLREAHVLLIHTI